MTPNRILFIVPPNITYEAYINPPDNVKAVTDHGKKLGTVVTDMPLGPMSLSAYVKKHTNSETKILDFNITLNRLPHFNYKSFKDLFYEVLTQPEWQEFNPTVFGISSLFSPAYNSVLDLAALGREIFPNAYVLGGGFLPTNMYVKIYEDSQNFHALCFGEGENALVRFIQAQDKLAFLENDPTWITPKKAAAKALAKSGKGIVQIGSKGLKLQEFNLDVIDNLDEIPFIDYDFLDIEGYALNPTMKAYPGIGKTAQNFHVMTSRGCVYSCSFCAQDTVHGKKMRYYSLKRTREDFLRLRDEYGVQTIIIEDDHFMGDEKRAYDILGIMIDLGMTTFFPNALALYALKRPMLERIKKVGVDQLVLAVESGSAEVLRNIMHKPLRLDIIAQVTKDCREIGIYTDCNIVVGQPGETKKHFEETRQFLKTTYANWFRFNIATPIVGSELLQKAADGGYLSGDYNECDYKKAIIETEHFTAKELQEMVYLFNLELNFVYNSDLRLGNFETALMGFENAISARPDHYFAHRYASLCYQQLGEMEKAKYHEQIANRSAQDPFWRKYINRIDVPVDQIANLAA